MKKLKSILTASLLLFVAPSWATENNVEQAQGSESAKLMNEKEINSGEFQSDPNFLLKNGIFVEKLIKGNIKKIHKLAYGDEILLKNNTRITILYPILLGNKIPISKIRIKEKYYLFINPSVSKLIQETSSAQIVVKDSNLIEECKECVDYLTKGK